MLDTEGMGSQIGGSGEISPRQRRPPCDWLTVFLCRAYSQGAADGAADEDYTLRWSSSTSPPVLSPFDFAAYGYGSCTAFATLHAYAARAIGVPARVVGAPCWNGGDFAVSRPTSPPDVRCLPAAISIPLLPRPLRQAASTSSWLLPRPPPWPCSKMVMTKRLCDVLPP